MFFFVDYLKVVLEQFFNRFGIYSEEIDRLQEKYPMITLLKGVEFSNPERHLRDLEALQKVDLDYVIGSNHIFPKDGSEREILAYYRRILEIVKNGGIDSLGHMDYLRRRYDDSIVPDDIISEIFNYLIKNDIALEINSSAIRRKGLDSFPSSRKLQLYREMGGTKVTIGSDAHRIHEIYDSISDIDKEYDFDKGLYLKRKFVSLNS